MVRIIHAADFHLDSAFSGLPPEKARQRRRESREILDRLTALARERQVDMVLLSGDLFDGERVYPETLERLRETLAALACPVFIAPGNHDPFTPRSPYARQTWPENVHIFRGGRPGRRWSCRSWGGCVVHGAAFTAPERTDQVLAGFTAPADGLVHILCLHGEVNAPRQPVRAHHPGADCRQRPDLSGPGPRPPVQRPPAPGGQLLGLPRLSRGAGLRRTGGQGRPGRHGGAGEGVSLDFVPPVAAAAITS